VTELVEVPLLRADGSFVTATLVLGIDETYAARTDDAWLTYLAAWKADRLAAGVQIPALQHEHWRWREKLAITANLLPYLTVSLELNGESQGLILYASDGHFARLDEQKTSPLVYVEFLAAAPWNSRDVLESPHYAGVGTLLMRVAVQASIDFEFKGRLGLHSLPQSEGFYRRLGMTEIGPDPDKENLIYFEFSADSANAFIS
jgi:hypothetical protein